MNSIKTVKEAHLRVSDALRHAGILEARQESRQLLAKVCGVEPSDILSHPETPITTEQLRHLQDLVNRRLNHEPLSHIIGERGFWTLTFKVNAHVLDPRPDSETLIEAILRHRPSLDVARRVLDFGTGSGCLLLSLLHEWPHATGVGVDLSAAALEVAQENARQLGLDERVEFVQSNWGAGLDGAALFDVIVSNPPYIAESEINSLQPEVRLHEPPMALFAGPDGLAAYRALLPDVVRLLKPSGLLALEVGIHQAAPVCALVQQAGLQVADVHNDLGGIPRCIIARKGAGGV